MFHRQAGKTTWAAHELVMKASQKVGTYFYISNTRDQGKEAAWAKLKKASENLQAKKPNETLLEIELVNGSRIAIKSAEVDTRLKGATLEGVVFDEYQLFPDERMWQNVIRPMLLITKGWAAFIGTPSTKNHFYNLFMYGQEGPMKRKSWKSWMLTVNETGIIDPEDLKEIKEETTENTFKSEYLCEFLDGEGKVFRRIQDNMVGAEQEPIPGYEYIIGVDVAKSEDWTVLCVVNRHTHNVDYVERFNQIDYEYQATKVEALSRKYNNAPVRIDATGKGDPIAELIERKDVPVDRFIYTNKSKKELIENLQIKMDTAAITYYHFEALIHELEVFEMNRTAKGNVTFNAPVGHHDDCVNALALAVWDIGERLEMPAFSRHPLLRDEYETHQETSSTGY